jgi:hypothetical protein
MTGSVTPDHILTLGGYWDWDSIGIMIHCGWDHIARAMIQTNHSWIVLQHSLIQIFMAHEKRIKIYIPGHRKEKREKEGA